MRFLIILGLYITCIFANINNPIVTQARILRSFDIDPRYIYSPIFKDIQSSINSANKREFMDVLRDGYSYIPMIKELIKKANIPDGFLYLAMVESGLSNHVTSNAKAVGMWQFMPVTAKHYGLRIDKFTDERRDPIAATTAAITHLKYLKNKFGKWYLAIMAYNCGDGKLARAISKAKTDDLATLLDPKKKYIPLETRIFIRKILTAAYIAKDDSLLSLKEFSVLNSRGINIVKHYVPGGTRLSDIADSIGISEKKILSYNSHITYGITPPNNKKYYIYIPKNKEAIFRANFKPKHKVKYDVYTAKNGDTVEKVAKKYGVSATLIKRYNKIKSNRLRKNTRLVVLQDYKPGKNDKKYVIRQGDTLSHIASLFNVKIADIKRANFLIDSKIYAGDSIVIPSEL